MEKLIELLNKYGKEKGNPFDEWGFNSNEKLFCKGLSSWYSEILIISRQFGFIKWLVENDKIDRDKFEVEYTDKQTLEDVYIAGAKQDELLIMILSISDTPIEDLISYLK